MTSTLALLAMLVAPLCTPIRCEWSAPGFTPAVSSSEVWSPPCPPFVSAAPATPGSYPVTLTVRCVRDGASTSKTLTVPVLRAGMIFDDGFEGGSLARWGQRYP